MRSKFTKAVGAVAVAVVGVVSTAQAERTWMRSEILAIADQEAKRLGYDVEQMSVAFDVDNSQWRKYTEWGSAASDLVAKLKDRKYWAVHYGSISDRTLSGTHTKTRGGLWIFIDRETAKVIDVFTYIAQP